MLSLGLFIVKIRVCEHYSPCALEINSTGGIKRACGILFFNHEKHISTFVYGHLGRVLIYRKGHPSTKSSRMILWSRGL